LTYDFDTCPDRRHTGSEKWDRYDDPNVIPMWVADMDFAAAPPIIEALHQRIDHGVFGYTNPTARQNQVLCDAMHRYYDWEIDPEWIVWLPNLVSGLTHSVRACAKPGEGVIMCPPIYPPFLYAPRTSQRDRIDVALQRIDNHWQLNFDQLRDAAHNDASRLLLWCHPHNPVGRAWTENELREVAEIMVDNDVVVCSDEIHCKLVYDGRRHLPFGTLSPEIADLTITLMSPSKTWNIPGIGAGFAVISNEDLRRKYVRAMRGFPRELNALSYVAATAAYEHGDPWRQELIDYLQGNRDLVAAAVDNWPGFSMSPVEATYLAWIDCRKSGLEDAAAAFEAVGVGLCPGSWYGLPGYVRLNFGCPRATLEEALNRMQTAVDGITVK
jgi:cystathionine beta-lyase